MDTPIHASISSSLRCLFWLSLVGHVPFGLGLQTTSLVRRENTHFSTLKQPIRWNGFPVQTSSCSRKRGRLHVWLSNHQVPFPRLSAAGDYYNFVEEEEDDDVGAFSQNDDSDMESNDFPPNTRKLIHQVTEKYIRGAASNETDLAAPLTIQDIQAVVNDEYTIRKVPVSLGSSDEYRVETPKSGGTTAEKLFAQTLSLAAQCRLPKQLTLELLSPLLEKFEELQPYVDSFASLGWGAVSFPRGLALRPRAELQSLQRRRIRLPLLLGRNKYLVDEARQAVRGAQAAQAPPRRLQLRQEFLAKMEAELSQSDPAAKRVTRSEMWFFPDSVAQRRVSLKRIQKKTKRQYSLLRQNGRAGFMSYCFFNFVFYTVGLLWQWPRIAPGDPLASSSSAAVVVLRKFGRVFASLYMASQVFKIPKLFGAVAFVPVTKRVLKLTSRKLRVDENVASAVLVGLMFATWLGLATLPALAEYAKLRQLVHMDERLLQLYGLQPV